MQINDETRQSLLSTVGAHAANIERSIQQTMQTRQQLDNDIQRMQEGLKECEALINTLQAGTDSEPKQDNDLDGLPSLP